MGNRLSKNSYYLKNDNIPKKEDLKEGFKNLLPLPFRLNTCERVKNDREFQKLFGGKYVKVFDFVPSEKKTEGSALKNMYVKIHTNPKGNYLLPRKKWLGKVGEVKIAAIKEYIAGNLYRLFGDGTFETTKTRLAYLPISNKFTEDNELAREIERETKSKWGWRVLSKWCEHFKPLDELFVKSFFTFSFSFMKYVEIFGRIPERVVEQSTGKEVELVGLMGLLAVSKTLADIDWLGSDGSNAGFVFEKNKNKEIMKIRIVKIDPGFAFEFKLMYEGLKNEKDIRFCTTNNGNYNNFVISWDYLSEKQKNEFLEVKLHHLEIIKDPKILEYMFFRDRKFSKYLTFRESWELMDSLVENIKREGEIYKDDLEQYKKIRKRIILEKAESFFNFGDYERSLCFYEKYLDIIIKSKESSELGEIYGSIARIEKIRGNEERFVEFSAKEFYFHKKFKNNIGLSKSYFIIGENFRRLGNYDESLVFFKKCLSIYQNNHQKKSNFHLIASCYNNIGLVYLDKQDYISAKSFFDLSYDIKKESILKESHPSFSSYHTNIGMILCNTGRFEEALKHFETSKTIVDSFYMKQGKIHPDIGKTYNNLGVVYLKLGKPDEAVECLLRCENYYLIEYTKNNEIFSSCYLNLGAGYNQLGDNKKAKAENLGADYNHLDDYKKAENYFLLALEIKRRNLPKNHLSVRKLEILVKKIRKKCK